MLTVTVIFFTLYVGSPSTFAQSDDLGSVLGEAQKSLDSQQSETKIDPSILADEYKTYKNVDYNVQVKYPKDWSFREMGFDELFPDRVFLVRFNSPVEAQAGIVLFSVSIENMEPSSTTLNEHKETITQIVKDNPDARELSISDTTLDGKPAYRLEYISWIVSSESKTIDVTSVNNGKLQEVSAFGDQSALDNYSDEITNMINSVKFGEPLIKTTNIEQTTQTTSDSDTVLESESATESEQQDDCDSSYPDFCIPPPPPNLNCSEISQKGFTVSGSDPHGFDRDNDGVGCES